MQLCGQKYGILRHFVAFHSDLHLNIKEYCKKIRNFNPYFGHTRHKLFDDTIRHII